MHQIEKSGTIEPTIVGEIQEDQTSAGLPCCIMKGIMGRNSKVLFLNSGFIVNVGIGSF